MAVRPYEFLTGIEESTIPTVSDPSADGDLFSFGYAEDNYAHTRYYGDGVQTITQLKAVAAADRYDMQNRWVDDKGADYIFDAASAAADDGDTVIQPDAGTGRWIKKAGGTGGGSAPELRNIVMGVQINAEDVPGAIYPAVKDSLVVTDSNKYIDFNEGSGDLVAVVPTGTYRYDNDFERAKLHLAIVTALEAVGTGNYTVTFDASTRKITIAADLSFTLKWKTGTHGSDNADDHIGTLLGYSDAADTSSATSHVADNPIDDTITLLLFGFFTDADFPGRSLPVQGVIETTGAQYSEKSIIKHVTVDNFSGRRPGQSQFTGAGNIVISSGVNDSIDLDEGGGELNATVAAGTYYAPYDDLEAAIKAACEAVGAKTYTVVYDHDTDKFTISVDTGTVAFPFLTGTNNATTIATTIGYTKTDKSALASHVAENRIALRGKLVEFDSTRLTTASKPIGVAQDTTNVHIKRKEGVQYLEALTAPNAWKNTPDAKDFADDEMLLGDQAENSLGQAVRVVLTNVGAAGSDLYRFQYKTDPNTPWQDSASTVSGNAGQDLNITADWNQNTLVPLQPRIAIDENGKAVCLLIRVNASGGQAVYAYHSTDGGSTWAKATGPDVDGSIIDDGATSNYPMNVAIRESKCFVVTGRTGLNVIGYSDDSGSGYASFSIVTEATDVMDYSTFSNLHIQYFPAETGVNKYRGVLIGHESGADTYIMYWKGDGTALGKLVNVYSDVTKDFMIASGIDRIGNGNRIVAMAGDYDTPAGIFPGYTNDDYNAGTLTFSPGSDISGGLFMSRKIFSNDHTTLAVAQQRLSSQLNNLIVNGSKGYVALQLGSASDDTTPNLYFMKSNDVTTNTWSTPVQIDGNAVGCSVNLVYLAGSNTLVAVWKEIDTTTVDLLTKGQIWASIGEIDGNNVNFLAAEQIDGGDAMGTNQSYPHLTSNLNSAHAAWLRDLGTRYGLDSNRIA